MPPVPAELEVRLRALEHQYAVEAAEQRSAVKKVLGGRGPPAKSSASAPSAQPVRGADWPQGSLQEAARPQSGLSEGDAAWVQGAQLRRERDLLQRELQDAQDQLVVLRGRLVASEASGERLAHENARLRRAADEASRPVEEELRRTLEAERQQRQADDGARQAVEQELRRALEAERRLVKDLGDERQQRRAADEARRPVEEELRRALEAERRLVADLGDERSALEHELRELRARLQLLEDERGRRGSFASAASAGNGAAREQRIARELEEENSLLKLEVSELRARAKLQGSLSRRGSVQSGSIEVDLTADRVGLRSTQGNDFSFEIVDMTSEVSADSLAYASEVSLGR